MLPRKFRLPLKTEYFRIKKTGHYLNGEFVTILYSPSSLGLPRFAFVVSKKISNKATKRNRVKRLIGEAVRSLIPEIKKPADFIIMAKPKILEKELLEIKEELKKLLAKI